MPILFEKVGGSFFGRNPRRKHVAELSLQVLADAGAAVWSLDSLPCEQRAVHDAERLGESRGDREAHELRDALRPHAAGGAHRPEIARERRLKDRIEPSPQGGGTQEPQQGRSFLSLLKEVESDLFGDLLRTSGGLVQRVEACEKEADVSPQGDLRARVWALHHYLTQLRGEGSPSSPSTARVPAGTPVATYPTGSGPDARVPVVTASAVPTFAPSANASAPASGPDAAPGGPPGGGLAARAARLKAFFASRSDRPNVTKLFAGPAERANGRPLVVGGKRGGNRSQHASNIFRICKRLQPGPPQALAMAAEMHRRVLVHYHYHETKAMSRCQLVLKRVNFAVFLARSNWLLACQAAPRLHPSLPPLVGPHGAPHAGGLSLSALPHHVEWRRIARARRVRC